MHPPLQASITELECLPNLQQRIDRVAEDLLSGERRYAALDARELGELLGLKFGSCEGWAIGRGWVERKEMPPDEGLSPTAERRIKFREGIPHYTMYEACAEACLFQPRIGVEEFMKWCSLISMPKSVTSSMGFELKFWQYSDGVNYEAFSPYIDFIEVDEGELFELRFVSPELNPPEIADDGYDEGEMWEWYIQKLSASWERELKDSPSFLPTDVKQCSCVEGSRCSCGAGLPLIEDDGCVCVGG